MADQPKQLTDPVTLELRLPPTIEEWAEEALAEDGDYSWDVKRTDDALIVRAVVHGNMNAVVNAQGFLRDVEETLQQANIDPMSFTLVAT